MKIYSICFVLFFFHYPIFAEEKPAAPSPHSLEDVTRAVLQNNPTIQQARAEWQAARERVPQAGAWEDPKISASSRLGRFVQMQPNGMVDQELSVEQMIPISGKNRSRARIAAAEAVAAGETLRRRELDAISAARSAYFEWQKVRALLALNRADLQSAQQSLENSRSRLAVAGDNETVLLNAESDLDLREEDQHALLEQLSDQQTRLNVLMNRDPFAALDALAELPADFSVKPFDVAKLRALALQNRPEVRMAEAQVAAARARVELARREWIPDPALSVDARRYNAAAQGVSEVGAGISFTVPWVNSGKYRAEEREAAAGLEAAARGLESARNEALGAVRDQLAKLAMLEHHEAIYREQLIPNARQTEQSVQVRYQSGRASFSDLVAAQNNAREMQRRWLERRARYRSALAELESITGAELHLFSNPTFSTPKH